LDQAFLIEPTIDIDTYDRYRNKLRERVEPLVSVVDVSPVSGSEKELVDLRGASWNQTLSWLRRIETLRAEEA
jgi:hypothetical protein